MSIFSAILARHDLSPPLLYGISDRRLHPDLTLQQYLECLFKSRAHWLQWREKDLPPCQQKSCLERGVRLARRHGKVFLVNTHTELALEVGADGVHLTSRQPVEESRQLRERAGRQSDFLIGKSVHSVWEGIAAEAEGVDYLLLGPVFDPISKESEFPPLGLPTLREAACMLYTPLFALGGITPEKAPIVAATTAVGIAGIGWLSDELESLREA